MTCDAVSKLIDLYFYGELSAADEERVEEHLHQCAACAREMERQRSLAALLDGRRVEPSPLLLDDCRAGLMAALQAPQVPPSRPATPWQLFFDAMAHSLSGLAWLRQPAAAVALLCIGFFAARFTGNAPRVALNAPAIPGEQTFATVRSIQPDGSGRVQIAFDETRRRVVQGSMEDQNIQRLLLAAAREENPAVRVESVDVLKNHSDSTEVRDALLNAVAHDPNPGVRLKALEGLKPVAADSDVRKALSQVLLADDNPAVRMQVVDLLVQNHDDDMVRVLQDVMQRESNNYVRLKSEQALKAMNASIGTF